ncbi:MAG: gliding motility-associated C-terminal domain-containing protein [Chitinophagales bacterium]|nr:gliding motility-associated C-terminal domain-containing protein [Chitinophagales bacterium]
MTLKQYIKPLYILAFFFFGQRLFAQPGNDGNMQVTVKINNLWTNEDGPTELGNNEMQQRFKLRDYPDLDGQSFFHYPGGGLAPSPTPYQYNVGDFDPVPYASAIPMETKVFTYGAPTTLGPNPAPLGIQWGFEGWEADCFDCFRCTGTFLGICTSWACDQCDRNTYHASCPCSGNILCGGGCSSDEAYCISDMNGAAYSPFRGFVPYVDAYRGVFSQSSYGANCGSDNYGVTHFTNWTSPCPDTIYTDQPVLCDPGYTTLRTGGAVFNGEFRWYRVVGGTEVFQQQTQDSFYTVYVSQTTKFRVYTCNTDDTKKSWSYREIEIKVGKPRITSVTKTDVKCNGASDGTITILATGGNGPLQYSIDAGTSFQNSNTFTGLAPGVYLINVTDGLCVVPDGSIPVQLNQPSPLATYVESASNVKCFGDSSGSVNISVAGGTPGYTFNWTKNAAPYATTEDIQQLSGGIYYVTVTDFNGCSASTNSAITEPAAPLSLSAVQTDATCADSANGAVDLTAVGGTVPYTYFWTNGAVTQDISGLAGGNYTVVVTDLNSCTATSNYAILQPAPYSFTDSIVNNICAGETKGAIFTAVSGGTPSYSYVWSNGQNTSAISNLASGVYKLTLSDTKNCAKAYSFNVTEPSAILTSVAGNEPDCNGNFTGFAVVTATGGTAPFTYNWSTTPAQASVLATKLPGNQRYYVTVTDHAGCQVRDSVFINEPAKVNVSVAVNNVTCFGGNNGTVVAHATGGTGVYTFYLNGIYSGDSVFNNLVANNYVVVAEDQNKCGASTTFTIVEPSQFSVKAIDDITALLNQPVKLGVTAFSSKGIKSYAWTPVKYLSCTDCTSPTATCDVTTDFVVTVTDSDGCVNYDTVRVIVKNDFLYFLPTAFTPNNDGLNDVFEVNILGAQNINMNIFNRWGETVYSSSDYANGKANGDKWDGKFRGKDVQFDTYTYLLKVKLYSGREETLTGTVAVMR